jgi:hypothetical protein
MPEAFELYAGGPPPTQKVLWAANRTIDLPLGIFVIRKRRQNYVELVKCLLGSPKALRDDQGFLERGR